MVLREKLRRKDSVDGAPKNHGSFEPKRRNFHGRLFFALITIFLVLSLVTVAICAETMEVASKDIVENTKALSDIYESGSILDTEGNLVLKPKDTENLGYANAATEAAYSNLIGPSLEEGYLNPLTLGGHIIPYLHGFYDNKMFSFLDFKRVGDDVKLNIRSKIQFNAYKALQSADFAYDSASIIVMNYKTGEILACTGPGYTAADVKTMYYNEDGIVDDLRSVTSAFKYMYPGSTIKPILYACALEMDPEFEKKTFDCTGVYSNVHCSNGNVHGHIGLDEAVALSCNGFAIDTGLSLDAEDLEEKMMAFGFDTKAKIPYITFEDAIFLPHKQPEQEEEPMSEEEEKNKIVLFPEEEEIKVNYDDSDALRFIGQNTTQVSPIQLTKMYAALFNKGVMPEAKFVKSVIESGKREKPVEYEAGKQIISEKTADRIIAAMKQTNIIGYGRFYDNADYQLASKTGTAELGDRNNIVCVEGIVDDENPYICCAAFTGVATDIGSTSAGKIATAVLTGLK